MVTSPQGLNVCGMRTSIAFCSPRGILLPLFFVALEISNSNTKVSRGQVHSLSEGPTRGHRVRLTCWSMHFHSSKYQNDLTVLR